MCYGVIKKNYILAPIYMDQAPPLLSLNFVLYSEPFVSLISGDPLATYIAF